ncbi:hypothetical protein M5K25_014226 [Dendrobium thyrsiflorum]|uniref:DUF4283 domain-containing protein n=1 Tax=Dendrobium thyrsiflorum TaxID=117978 RepID=A0ABD0UV24_DENTH
MAGRLVNLGFLMGKPSSRSFKDALANDSHSSSFPELKISSHRGMPSLWISEGEILALAAPFEFALVVCRVFAHRSYFVNNCYIKLFKWSPMFDVEVKSPIIPIWVSFPHLFTPRILNGLGSLFGQPLITDHATACDSRSSIARVLVELDVTKHYPDRVWVGPENLGYIQEVIMEEFLSYCSQCKSLGHSKLEFCSLNKTPKDALQSNVELVNEKLDLDPLKEVVNVDTGGVSSGLPVPVLTPVVSPKKVLISEVAYSLELMVAPGGLVNDGLEVLELVQETDVSLAVIGKDSLVAFPNASPVLDVVNTELGCVDNVMLNDSLSGKIDVHNEPAMPPSLANNLVEIPVISIFIENLKAQLNLSRHNACLEQIDWLEDLSEKDEWEELQGDEEFDKMINFIANHLVGKALSQGSGKRMGGKNKRK